MVSAHGTKPHITDFPVRSRGLPALSPPAPRAMANMPEPLQPRSFRNLPLSFRNNLTLPCVLADHPHQRRKRFQPEGACSFPAATRRSCVHAHRRRCANRSRLVVGDIFACEIDRHFDGNRDRIVEQHEMLQRLVPHPVVRACGAARQCAWADVVWYAPDFS
jgi:hypothetical protein